MKALADFLARLVNLFQVSGVCGAICTVVFWFKENQYENDYIRQDLLLISLVIIVVTFIVRPILFYLFNVKNNSFFIPFK